MLVAAAVILIPEMLSGPRRQAGDLPAPVDGQAPLKTYTIDLSKSPATQAAAASGAADRAPPAESTPMPAAASETQPSAAGAQPTPQSGAAPESSAPNAAPVDDTNSSVAVEAPPPSSPSQPASKVEPAPTKGSAAGHSANGWAVQLGSFSSEATAQRMVKDLRAKGHEAFVMPVNSGSGTMYRVRIGPMADREAAAAALQGVKSLAPGAAVVAHP